MIRELVDIGAPYKVLPIGIHDATLEEVERCYATNSKRRQLFKGLTEACGSLKLAGCIAVYLDGSYVTDIPYPGDYDVCWNPINVDETKLDPVFLDFTNKRSRQKSKYGGEFFLNTARADGTYFYIQYFQKDKETGLQKGIIRINL